MNTRCHNCSRRIDDLSWVTSIFNIDGVSLRLERPAYQCAGCGAINEEPMARDVVRHSIMLGLMERLRDGDIAPDTLRAVREFCNMDEETVARHNGFLTPAMVKGFENRGIGVDRRRREAYSLWLQNTFPNHIKSAKKLADEACDRLGFVRP